MGPLFLAGRDEYSHEKSEYRRRAGQLLSSPYVACLGSTARLWESLKRARFSRQANSEQMCFYIKQTYSKMIKHIYIYIYEYTCTAKTKHVSYKSIRFKAGFSLPSTGNFDLYFSGYGEFVFE